MARRKRHRDGSRGGRSVASAKPSLRAGYTGTTRPQRRPGWIGRLARWLGHMERRLQAVAALLRQLARWIDRGPRDVP